MIALQIPLLIIISSSYNNLVERPRLIPSVLSWGVTSVMLLLMTISVFLHLMTIPIGAVMRLTSVMNRAVEPRTLVFVVQYSTRLTLLPIAIPNFCIEFLFSCITVMSKSRCETNFDFTTVFVNIYKFERFSKKK